MTGGPWWQTFFDGLVVEAQRHIAGVFPTKAEADFLERELKLKPSDHVLDVPCGNGRLALELAARGYATSGVDLCDPLLTDARRAAAERGLVVSWNLRDMRDPPPGPFDAAFCFGNSFAYFDTEGDAEFLRAVANVLKPGGRFALETHFVAETFFSLTLGKRWYQFDDLLFLHDSAYDPATSAATSDYVIMRGARTERKRAVYRVYTFSQLCDMCRAAGLEVVAGHGSLSGEPLRIGSAGLWLVTKKS